MDSGLTLRVPRNDGGELQKALRIDVHLELLIALRLWADGEPVAQIVRQIETARRLHQDAEAVATLDHGERGFRRAQHHHALVARRERNEAATKTFRARAIAGGDDQARKPAERRIERALAQIDLAVVERLAVAGDQRLHHGMVRLVRLEIADAAALLASGAADHLVEQLPGAFRGARIAIAQAQIRVDHADQIEPRKIMALRPELCADDDVDARLREQRSRLLLQALDAGPDRDQRFLRRAVRAGLRPRHREAAMVTDQPLAEAVIDQPCVANGAGEAMAAGAAQGQWRIAAAIEEQ